MTGRFHQGDENKNTQYEYATLKAVDENGNVVSGTITVEDIQWSSPVKESESDFRAPSNRVIVGRQHHGDENKNTQYATAVVKFNGEPTIVEDIINSNPIKESAGIWFRTDSQRVITGRSHIGDENKNTVYYSGVIATEPKSGLTEYTVKGYTTKTEIAREAVGSIPDGDHYITVRNTVGIAYRFTYEIPNVKEGEFFENSSPNCGCVENPLYGGGVWMVQRRYNSQYAENKMILTSYCVLLLNKDETWYPCNPEEMEWNYIINR